MKTLNTFTTERPYKGEPLPGTKRVEPMMKQARFRRLFDRHAGIVFH
ncbi:MAG: hypothetical protein WBA23_12805 [Tunicatimonas sp.]